MSGKKGKLSRTTGRTSQGSIWHVHGPLVICGELEPPCDKSIAHRAILLSALGMGASRISGLSGALDVESTAEAVAQLGIQVKREPGAMTLEGRGLLGLCRSARDIDCGNSGTTMRLLTGILAAQPFSTRLVGDASLMQRPMGRITIPLNSMGARIRCAGDRDRPPLLIEGQNLTARSHELTVDSAQVRSSLLLAGLFATGPTQIRPRTVARDHTQRMLRFLGVRVEETDQGTTLWPSSKHHGWPAFDMQVPGDLSAAAFWVALAAAQPGGSVTLRHVGLNPGRARYLEILRLAGSQIEVIPQGEEAGEPVGEVRVRGGALGEMILRHEDVVQCIDEIPALLVAGAIAGSRVSICDASELRVKESDRLSSCRRILQAFGAKVVERSDGILLEAGTKLTTATVDAQGDHRIAMASMILAAHCTGVSAIQGIDCVATSYPRFHDDFQRLIRRKEGTR